MVVTEYWHQTGSAFVGWDGDCTSSSVVMDRDRTCIARFGVVPQISGNATCTPLSCQNPRVGTVGGWVQVDYSLSASSGNVKAVLRSYGCSAYCVWLDYGSACDGNGNCGNTWIIEKALNSSPAVSAFYTNEHQNENSSCSGLQSRCRSKRAPRIPTE